MEKEQFLAAVYMLIINDHGKVLLQRRKGTKLWPGFLALPAGHIDEGENAIDAVIREAKEELNIVIRPCDIGDCFVANRRNKSLKPYFDVYFEIVSYSGDICINEPDKCSELVWCDFNNLPEDMVDFQVAAIKNRQRGVVFSVFDADNEKTL